MSPSSDRVPEALHLWRAGVVVEIDAERTARPNDARDNLPGRHNEPSERLYSR